MLEAGAKRLLPRTLLGRSLLILVMPLILLQLITAWVFFDRHWGSVTRRMTDALAGDIAAVIELLQDAEGDAGRVAAVQELARANLTINATFLPGTVLPAPRPAPPGALLDPILANSLRQKLGLPFRVDSQIEGERIEILVRLPDGVLRILAPRERLWSAATWIFILWMVGTSLVLFAIATVFMRNQVRPIRRLAAAAEMFGKGRAVPDFRPAGALEVRQAGVAFNIMKQRIQRQLQQRTEMLAGVSHDLRTPLTRMKLELAMMGSDPNVDALTGDVAQMQEMVDAYLAFARGEGEEEPVATDLEAMARNVAHGVRHKQAEISVQRTGNVTVPVRAQAIRRCLANLVDNAARYGRQVEIHLRRRGGSVQIIVDDDGPGIPRKERARAFQPFYRLDPARGPDTGGVGLGLTIARDVIRGHGGEITLGDSPTGGLRATLRLPV